MSKRKREKDKQKRAEDRLHGRNHQREVKYAQMAEQGIQGAREKARNAKHRREYGKPDNDYDEQPDSRPRSYGDTTYREQKWWEDLSTNRLG